MRRLDLSLVQVSFHFHKVREDRGIPWRVVQRVLSDPHVTESHAGHVRYVRDGVTVVVAMREHRDPVLVTLLLRRQERWNNADARTYAERMAESEG